MHRNSSYDQLLSKELRDREFAQGFILDLTEGEDGLTVEEALKHTIRRMGITEYSKCAKVPASNVAEFLAGRRKLKPETLDYYLKPFGLKVELTLKRAC